MYPNLWQLTAVFILCLLLHPSSGTFSIRSEPNEGVNIWRHVFVSRLYGKDTEFCGRESHPCKTLGKVFSLKENNLHVHIDGAGTEQDPYNCGNVTVIKMIKNLVLEGFTTSAHLSCKQGIGLGFAPVEQVGLVTMSRITFTNTPLFVRQHSIAMSNCIFRDFVPSKLQNAAIIVEVAVSSTVVVSIEGTKFRNNSVCLIVKGKGLSNNTNLSLFVRNTTFIKNNIQSVFVYTQRLQYFKMNIICEYVVFDRNQASFLVVSKLPKAVGKSVISETVILNSVFSDNVAIEVPVLIGLCMDPLSSCSLRVANTIFVSNTVNNAILCSVFSLNFSNVTMMNTTLGNAVSINPTSYTKVFLKRCVFGKNMNNLFVGKLECEARMSRTRNRGIFIVVQDVMFYGYHAQTHTSFSKQSSAVTIKFEKGSTDASYISFNNVTFQEILDLPVSIDWGTGRPLVFITIRRCSFRYNGNAKTISATVFVNIPLAQTRSAVVFENTQFEENVGINSIIEINLNTSFKNCYFKNNFVVSQGATIRLTEQGSLQLHSTNFLSSNETFKLNVFQRKSHSFLSFENGKHLTVENVSFVVNVSVVRLKVIDVSKFQSLSVDNSTSITCSKGSELQMIQMQNVLQMKSVSFSCIKCTKGLYSIDRGRSKGFTVIEKSTCLTCPYGAECLGNVKAKRNFWGYVTSKDSLGLRFVLCPLKYCQQSHNDVSFQYNSCYGNRSGVLCGRCASRYTEELFTTECRERKHCKDFWFWPLTLAYISILALYLVFKPPPLSVLYRHMFWFRNQRETDNNPSDNCERHNEGYVKIIFCFYQIAGLLLVTTSSDLADKVTLIFPIVALFNFEMRFFHKSLGCPVNGLTVVTKELFISLKVPTSILCLLPIYIVHWLFNKATRRSNPSYAPYVAVALEMLLLGYQRLTETSLKLLQCVPIGNTWKLFYDGNTQCFQAWQTIFVGYVAVFGVPFIFILYWGSLKLHANSISVKEFLFSCILPLPFLCYWAARYYLHLPSVSNQHSVIRSEISGILHQPFRALSEQEQSTLHWESVLIGRRFFLLCLYSFIPNPMPRLFFMSCGCLLMLLHHLVRKPYRNPKSNVFESISLFLLVIIALATLMEASLVSAGVEPLGPNKMLFTTIQWLEIIVLGFLPAVFCVLVVFALLSQCVRFVIKAPRLLLIFARGLTYFTGNSVVLHLDNTNNPVDTNNMEATVM